MLRTAPLNRTRCREAPFRRLTAGAILALVAACGTTPETADPASDAPEGRSHAARSFPDAPIYAEALRTWRTAEDVNAWIGAKFEYDMSRALLLSETQRGRGERVKIARPEDFFGSPRGVCVDLSRFAVETLRAIDPKASANFLMIEFSPASISGNVLRLHWLATFRRDGRHYFFADSKRPGHLAGPYATVAEFIKEYEGYRGRRIVAFRELESHERQPRTKALKRESSERP